MDTGEGSGAGQEGTGLRAAAAILAASAVLSLVLGYGRDMLLAYQLGAGPESDAYFAAFMLPDLLNYLLAGGALAIAFMPLYNRIRHRRGQEAGDRLVATTLGTLGALSVAATAILWIYADALVALQFPRFSEPTRALATHLTRIVLPAQIFFITGGIMRSVLMAHGSFAAQGLAPLFYNGFVIVGGIAMGSVEGFAWGVLVGAGVGTFGFPLVQLWRRGRLRLRVAPLDADFRAYLWLALPLMLGLGLTTVDEWYEKWFGQIVGEGSVAALTFARKLMRAPVTVVGQAVAAAALPTLSRLWSAGQVEEMDRTLLRTLRESLAVAILAAAALIAMAPAVVELLYRHGRFSTDDAAWVSSILVVLAFAVPGWVVQQVAVRAFFAREDTWRPMFLNTGMALAVIPLYLSLARSHGAEGLAAAGVVAISVNALATVAWARRRHGAPSLAALGASALRASAAAAPAAAAAAWLQAGRVGKWGALTDLGLGSLAFVVVAALSIAMFGDEAVRRPLRALVQRAWGVLRGSKSASG